MTFNSIERYCEGSMLYSPCRYRTGEDSDGGPVWADYKATLWTAWKVKMSEPMAHIYANKSITYLDVLSRVAYFHEINI